MIMASRTLEWKSFKNWGGVGDEVRLGEIRIQGLGMTWAL